MINNITSNHTYISVDHTGGGMPYISSGQPSVGMVGYNVSTRCLEVYNGTNNWYRIGSDINIDLSLNVKEHNVAG